MKRLLMAGSLVLMAAAPQPMQEAVMEYQATASAKAWVAHEEATIAARRAKWLARHPGFVQPAGRVDRKMF
jgi:hypothetical protein